MIDKVIQENIKQLNIQQKAVNNSMKALESQFNMLLPLVKETHPELADEVLKLKNEMQKPENVGKNSFYLNKFEELLNKLNNAG